MTFPPLFLKNIIPCTCVCMCVWAQQVHLPAICSGLNKNGLSRLIYLNALSYQGVALFEKA